MKRWGSIVAVILASSLGCGLSDYEQRMDEQRARMKVFDEENQVLGDLIETPMERIKDKDGSERTAKAWPFDMFFRVPTGITARAENKEGETVFVTKELKLYAFRGAFKGMAGYGLLVAASPIGKRDKDGNLVDGLPAKEFQDYVFEAIDLYMASKKYGRSQFEVKVEKETFRPAGAAPGTPGVDVDLVTYRPLDAFATDLKLNVYFHRNELNQVAIGYQFPARKDADALLKDAIRLALCRLDIGPTAAARRSLYQTSRRSDFVAGKS